MISVWTFIYNNRVPFPIYNSLNLHSDKQFKKFHFEKIKFLRFAFMVDPVKTILFNIILKVIYKENYKNKMFLKNAE